MNALTYKQAYDKIIEAYFKDEIRPNDPHFCFCGTLNNNKGDYWCSWRTKLNGINYTAKEFQQLESALYMGNNNANYYFRFPYFNLKDEDYEDKLFAGMCAALEVLKEIHRNRGENVEDVPQFRKRMLMPQN